MRSNDNWNEDDDLDMYTEATNDDTNGIKDLRKAKRADEKRIKELMERLEKFERQERESTVAKVLESKGVNSKAARLILKDLDEVNEEAVSNWLEDNGDLIGYQPQVEEPVQNQSVREFSRQDGVTQSATTSDASDDLIDMLQNYNGSSEDELLSIIQQIAGKSAD
jgi:hypothetical protein